MSRLAWGVWVEILQCFFERLAFESRLAWGVWVEIQPNHFAYYKNKVTPRMRRVSRNICDGAVRSGKTSRLAWGVWVEISSCKFHFLRIFVTPCMRCVSRKPTMPPRLNFSLLCLAWGVWVEMKQEIIKYWCLGHAVHEGVSRNCMVVDLMVY